MLQVVCGRPCTTNTHVLQKQPCYVLQATGSARLHLETMQRVSPHGEEERFMAPKPPWETCGHGELDL